MKTNKQEIIFAICAIVLGVLTRTIFDLGINIEMITGFGIACGFFFKNKKLAYAVPLLSMFFSDLVIKNTYIYLFTWSGFLCGPFIGTVLRALINNKESKFAFGIIGSQLAGIISTLFFFVWTNFGVWLIGNMYSKDFSGLALSYVNAIPFLNNQLVGNLIIVPLVFVFGVIFFNLEKILNIGFRFHSKQT